MGIKYEAVFGDQSLFEESNSKSDLVVVSADVSGRSKTYFFASLVAAFNFITDFPPRGIVFHSAAMRRIIRTPTWTVADQKAGRLPDVGCRVGTSIGECVVIGVDLNLNFVGVQHQDDGCMDVLSIDTIKPIESPEEKAARLEDEFYQAVRKTCAIGPSEEQAFRLACKVAHRMMLSGDLPVPVKGDK